MCASFSSNGSGAELVATGILPVEIYKYAPATGINNPTISPKINFFTLALLDDKSMQRLIGYSTTYANNVPILAPCMRLKIQFRQLQSQQHAYVRLYSRTTEDF
jgi:hypothetical protein